MSENPTKVDNFKIEDALTDLVMNCPELVELEARLSKFNVFKILKADQYEIRHSNMLAWLLDPDGAHGLDFLFLRRWLMEVMFRARQFDTENELTVSPISINGYEFSSVQVHRELHNIDVLLVMKIEGQDEPWVVCIENKVKSRQSKNQLQGYRKAVEAIYPESKRHFLFLTKHYEEPADKKYLSVSYESVAEVLDRCMAERRDSIGVEPALLINHYRQLLRDDFMDENEPARLAQEIYKRHSKAIDFILENKRDPIFEITNKIEEALQSRCDALKIVMSKTGKGRIRFLPMEWNTDANKLGQAWGDKGHFLVLELDLYMKKVELSMLAAGTPDGWSDELWEKCDKPPLQRSQKDKPAKWLKAYRAKSRCSVNDESVPEQTADEILSWLDEEMKSDGYLKAKEILTQHLNTLDR